MNKGHSKNHVLRRMPAMLRAKWAAVCIVLTYCMPSIIGAQAPAQKLSISMSSTGMPSIELYIAREKNFFREEGFEPQLSRSSFA